MNVNSSNNFALVLHCHLPFVIGHGQWPHGMDWLNEAAAETYIPLLNMFNDLVAEGVEFAVTLDISPVLAEQLIDERFKNSFKEYMETKIRVSGDNLNEFSSVGDENKRNLAIYWRDFYRSILEDFKNKYSEDIAGAFSKLQREGHIELMTCGATHGYFPLLYSDESISAQIKTAIESHKRIFGKKPPGIWLPECAYRPRYKWKSFIDEDDEPRLRRGIEEFLSDNGIKYFVIDSHLLKGGKAIGTYLSRFEALKKLWDQFSESYKEEDKTRSPFKLYWAGNRFNDKIAVVFARNEATSLQVWSGEWGYPGNSAYLDFHKKHFPGGNRYWAVTGRKVDLAEKQEYRAEWIEDVINEQAYHFANLIRDQLIQAGGGILAAPFDAELFGHWWFEGPRWIKRIFIELSKKEDVKPVTLNNYFEENPAEDVVSLPEGSWGEGGFHYIWLNDWTKWTWKHIHDNEKIMIELADKYKDTDNKELIEILNQMSRELLLLQSSDWQFLISTWSARDYAEQRIVVHNDNFKILAGFIKAIEQGDDLTSENRSFINRVKEVDSFFKDINFKFWCNLGEA